jgi:hypothetical protein
MPPPGREQRRHVAGRDEPQPPEVGLDDREEQRGHRVRRHGDVVGVQPPREGGGAVALERVGARDAAQLAHAGGRRHPAAGHVAHHDAQPAAGQGQRVVPVAADGRAARARGEVGGDADARDLRQPLGQEVALERGGEEPLALVQRGALDDERHALGDVGQHRLVDPAAAPTGPARRR